MEIEVGEYVRTKGGHFYKITKIDENGLIYWNKIQCGWNMQQLEDIITKHSKNIIDLIEVGDLCVMDEDIVYMYDEGFINAVKEDIENGHKLISIVTREQFENNAYKVEE